MKKYIGICASIILISIVCIIIANIILLKVNLSSDARPYRVEAERIAKEIETNGYEKLELINYTDILDVVECTGDADAYETKNDYLIKEVNGKLYRIEYRYSDSSKTVLPLVNTVLILMLLVLLGVLIYIGVAILKPFHRLKELPYELSKGNLTMPVKESRSKLFGRFLWGMDLLRENLEEGKEKELQLQKEKKTLVLSLSHDIRTPLSAIRLYAKALSSGIYKEKEKQMEAVEGISKNVIEIERYVNEIIKASNEDFLNLEVKMGEFYLGNVVSRISKFYEDKLSLLKTKFFIESLSDCILKGDADRFEEVLQNIMENAIKYGDGESISISFEEEEDCRLITVTNSGCSLQGSELPHIFDSFWRGSNVNNKPGNGLGLYICRELMRQMDGDIYAEIVDKEMQVTIVARKA